MTKWFLGSSLVLFMGVVSTSHANNQEAAKKAFETGVVAFQQDQYESAVNAFRRAYALNPAWKLLYNIGQCEVALKRYGLAVDVFEQYLFEGGDNMSAARRDEVLSELDRLRKMTGTVLFNGPDGIDVIVDGVHRGVTPITAGVLVAAGGVARATR